MRRSLLLVVFVAVAPGSFAQAEERPHPKSSEISHAQRAEGFVERIRRGDPAARDEATRGLLELAEIEDERTSGERPVHEVLKRALLDQDPEVRFRVRRVLADPEVRVERLLVSLLEPQQTDQVLQTRRALLERADRSVARAGLARIARKAAREGLDPLTSALNETWHPWGMEGGARIGEHSRRRFHLALDLLSEMKSDDEVAIVCDLLQEDLGDSLTDVIEALASRPTAAREQLRIALKDPSPRMRENAAWALGEIGTAEDVPALDAALADSDPRVRRAVVTAFEMLPVDAAACVRAAGHANDPDLRVATAGLHLGAVFGHRFVSEPARKILASSPAAEVPMETRVHAMRALARVGDTDGTLRGVMASRERTYDGSLKFAAWSAGATCDQEAMGSLEGLLGRDEYSNEPGIFYGIARSGATGWLERLARSDRDETRRLAIQAFGSAKGDADKIAECLEKAATRAVERENGSDWNDFLLAFRALRDRDDEPSRKAIGGLLDLALGNQTRGNGVNDETLLLLVEYVNQARSTRGLRGLVAICRTGRNQYTRIQAMEALATIDPRRAREVLGPMLDVPQSDELLESIARNLGRAGDTSRSEKAVEIAKRGVAISIGQQGGMHLSEHLNSEGIEHAYAGQVEDALLCFRRMRWLQTDNKVASYNAACAFALAGDKENALRWLRRSVREGFKDWRHIHRDADLACLYEDARFLRLVDQLRRDQEVEPAVER